MFNCTTNDLIAYMPVTLKQIQTPRRFLYPAIFIGVLILLYVIVGNNRQDNHENLQHARNSLPAVAPNTNTDTTNSTPTPAASSNGTPTPFVAGQPDPFKSFLETRKNDNPSPANPQPGQQNPQTKQEIQDKFIAAVNNQQALSIANPFGTAQNPNSTDGSGQNR